MYEKDNKVDKAILDLKLPVVGVPDGCQFGTDCPSCVATRRVVDIVLVSFFKIKIEIVVLFVIKAFHVRCTVSCFYEDDLFGIADIL
jgi:hypothetical protein